MRLFRRTLLCLVVGVTAFGAAGWMLRPTPSWVLDLGTETATPGFVSGGAASAAGDRVWLVAGAGSQGKHSTSIGSARYIDATRGTILRDIPIPGELDKAQLLLTDYRLVFGRTPYNLVEGGINETRFAVVEPDNDDAPRVHVYRGDWHLTDDGQRAWRADESADGLRIEYLQVGRDWTIGRLQLDRRYSNIEPEVKREIIPPYAVSPDGRRLALSQKIRYDCRPPFAMELWDIDAGTLVQTLPLPPTPNVPTEHQGAWPMQFLETGEGVRLSWNDGTADYYKRNWVWRFGPNELAVAAGQEEVEFTSPDGKRQRAYQVDAYGDDEVWATHDSGEDMQIWFTIRGRGRPLNAWRKYPFPIPSSQRSGCVVSTFGPAFQFVPGRTDLVAACSDLPLAAAIPEGLRRYAPKDWDYSRPEPNYRWHQWEKDEWREVGCHAGVRSTHVLSNAYLTVTQSEDSQAYVSSWPLPPRDPKPPALAIAALCMAGTWWLCAWRYRRRTRLASVDAA